MCTLNWRQDANSDRLFLFQWPTGSPYLFLDRRDGFRGAIVFKGQFVDFTPSPAIALKLDNAIEATPANIQNLRMIYN
jgi:hypothetical protein